MFRIKKIFENDSIVIHKVEGEVSNGGLSDWANEIKAVIESSSKQVILEFCQVSYMSPMAIEVLAHRVNQKTYVMNSPGFIRNMLTTAGLSDHLLD
ncbi:hypothetical protein D6833_03050 [Candidatus Parcubacteria bacterium]|nr:MAG: hypothetical protein D6833_03050 [Candidatus Parcubacteria bacterium]